MTAPTITCPDCRAKTGDDYPPAVWVPRDEGGHGFIVICENCDLTGNVSPTEAKAIKHFEAIE